MNTAREASSVQISAIRTNSKSVSATSKRPSFKYLACYKQIRHCRRKRHGGNFKNQRRGRQDVEGAEGRLREEGARRRQAHAGPTPIESKHLFAVRSSTYNDSPPPRAISSPLKLQDFVRILFANPTALAICPPKEPEKQKTYRWICFNKLTLMERFVQQLDSYRIEETSLILRIIRRSLGAKWLGKQRGVKRERSS